MSGSVNPTPFLDGEGRAIPTRPAKNAVAKFATTQTPAPPDAKGEAGQAKREGSVFQEALAWPVFMGARQCASPLVIGGIVTFFVVPYAYPFAGRGEAFLTGYASGIVTYLARFGGKDPLPPS